MATIVRRNQNWVPSIFNDLFDADWLDTRVNTGVTPAINVKETKNDYTVEVAAPGMTKDDFDVRLNWDAFGARLHQVLQTARAAA